MWKTRPVFRKYRQIERLGSGANRPKGAGTESNRRSFDYASRDETARDSAQDDNFYVDQTLSNDLCRSNTKHLSMSIKL